MHRQFLTFLLVCVLLVTAFMVSGVGQVEAEGSALWFGKFYDNPDLAGDPVVSKSTGLIDFNWGDGSPADGVPADNFSVRWSALVEFEPGTYRFTTVSDDGVQLFVGDKHIISNWSQHPPTTDTVVVSLLGGQYPASLDYFEKEGGAQIRLDWTRLGPARSAEDVAIVADTSQPVAPEAAPPPIVPALPEWAEADWFAHYWGNSDFSGAPASGRLEGVIDFDWGDGSPGNELPADSFSASWSSFVTLPPGTYRFVIESAGGVRFFFNDRHIIVNWQEHGLAIDSATVLVAGGTYPMAVEYFEESGQALVRVGWERIGAAASAGGPATATTTTNLRLRGGPGTEYEILAVAPVGTTVSVTGRTADNGWIQVNYRGTIGWMGSRFLRIGGSIFDAPIIE